MDDFRCAMPGAIPPRPHCQQQCPSCKTLWGEPTTATAFTPGCSHAELYSGGYVDLNDPSPKVIVFEDVAESLAKTCRYTGHCRGFYSVAEHAVLVAWRLEALGCDWDLCLAGLHHDDGEILTGDISSPLKACVPEFKAVEERCHRAVVKALGKCISQLPFDDLAVKEADEWALMQEAYVLMSSRGAGWHLADRYPQGSLPWLLGLDWRSAQRFWIECHHRLLRTPA